MSTNDSPTPQNPSNHNPLTYDCPACGQSHDDVYELQSHYQNTHDPDWTRQYPTKCLHCDTIHRRDKHTYERAERHFCSNDCHDTWQRTVETHARTTDRTEGIEATCDHCGNTFTRPKYDLEQADQSFCSNDCQGKHLSGQNHHRWTGARSFDDAVRKLIHKGSWERISRERREQHPVCEQCGERTPVEDLHSHHIIPILAGGTHDEELLMTVCNKCHHKVETFTEDAAGDHVEKVCLPEELRNTTYASVNISHARNDT